MSDLNDAELNPFIKNFQYTPSERVRLLEISVGILAKNQERIGQYLSAWR